MDVNFCSHGLTVSVKSSAVTCDGYEVDNLISSDFFKKQKGFLAERFIKPPVTLTFEFACDIQINYLVIQSNVGAQKSAGLEVLTSTNSDDNRGEIAQDTKLNSVAFGIIKSEETGFVFYRHGYDIRKKIPVDNFVFSTFKSSRNLVTRVLTIKIFKTYGSSIPALGRVEVWGRPSSGCPKNVIDNVYNCWKQHVNRACPVFSDAEVVMNRQCNNKTDSRISWSADFKIPDEFLDPITCEIMVLPVILPCGKIIDKFTLEKHNETESHWGRSPSDPFTGILFSETNKPVIADDLKARIDKFLCDNSNETLLMNVPRTVGRKASNFPDVCNGIKQRDCENGDSLNRHCCDKPSQDSSHRNCDSGSDLTDSRNCEKGRNVNGCVLSAFENMQSNIDTKSNELKAIHKEIQLRRCNIVSKNVKFFPYAQNTTLSHEEMSQRSLDNLLKSTLSSLPSLCQTSLKGNVSEKCVTCKDSNNLFQMPCIHVVCRSCLVYMVNKKQLKCADCEVMFKASDVRRVHI